MKRSTLKYDPIKHMCIKVAICFMATLFVMCMDDKVAGTTSSTENPSVISMAFMSGAAPKKITGQVQIYPAHHNPVFDSLPLAVLSLDAHDSISLTKKTVDSIVRIGKPDAIVTTDSLYSLNFLVYSDLNEGGFTRGLVYDYKAGRFLDRGIPIKHSVMEIDSLVHYEGGLKIEGSQTAPVNYLYVTGTPFFAILNNESSRFSFGKMPKGGYKVLWLPTGYKVTGQVTYNIIALDDSLRTDSSHVFTPVSIEDTLQSLPGTPRGRD